MVAFLDARLSVDFLKEQSTRPREEDRAGLFDKDYEKLLFAALEEHNIPKAKKVLHDVKDEFSARPPGSPERRQLEALLHALYKKFKSYLEEQTTLSKMEHAIDAVNSPDIAQRHLAKETDGFMLGKAETTSPLRGTTETASLRTADAPLTTGPKPSSEPTSEPASKPLSEPVSEPAAEPTNPAPEANPDYQDFLATTHFLDDALADNDLAAARDHYKQTQILFKKIPLSLQKQHHQQLLAYRQRTIDLMRTAAPNKKSPEPVTSRTPGPQGRASTTEERLVAAMKANDLHEAMLQYEELRDAILALPQQERDAHTPRMRKYHEWILSAWNKWRTNHQTNTPTVLEQHERRLSGKP